MSQMTIPRPRDKVPLKSKKKDVSILGTQVTNVGFQF